MAEEKMEMRCPRCTHEWTQDLSKVKSKRLNYRERGENVQYRITCPECGGHWLLTTAEEGERAPAATAEEE